MAKEPAKENAALDAVLSKTNDTAVAPTASAPAAPVAGRVFRAEHSKTCDTVVETTDAGQVERQIPRKLKCYRVLPVGAPSLEKFGKDGVLVENCVDESEAKQVAYQNVGVGHESSKYQTKVVAA